MTEKAWTKRIFYFTVTISFIMIMVFNFLTPYSSDDFFYRKVVQQATSLWDLFVQEYQHYMTTNGRSIAHFILRCFLTTDKWVFNIANSIVYVILSLLIYVNIERKKKYDIGLYLLIQILLWSNAVAFGQTILWMSGSCSYLWGTTIILGFITVLKNRLTHSENINKPIIQAVGLFLFGVIAGWCSENTTGGAILYLCILIGYVLYEKRKLPYWIISGLAGMITGFMFMLNAPGYKIRSQYMEPEHTGFLKYAARFLKINIAVKNNFALLLCILVIVLVIAFVMKVDWKQKKNVWIFTFIAAATCYALVLSPEPQNRVYFGAGIFLIIACLQGITDLPIEVEWIKSMKISFIVIGCLWLASTYFQEGANVARINRECNERVTFIEEQKAAGNYDVIVPLLRPEFKTRFSDCHNTDIEEDSKYWINQAYAGYYELHSLSGVSRDEWDEQHEMTKQEND